MQLQLSNLSKQKSHEEDSYVLLVSIDGMANYYLDDPQVRMPNLRRLMREGAVAKGMESVFPTATWAIHSSLVTGTYPRKHGVLGNWVIDRPTRRLGEHFGDKMWGKEESICRETIYDAAKRMGWTTASLCWPVTRGAQAIDWNIPEFYEQELFEAYSTPELWKELQAAGLLVECYGDWSKDHAKGVMQEWLTTEIAKHIIRTHHPRLFMVHFLLPDSLQHDYGIQSPEVYWSLEYIDERIGELLAVLETEQIMPQTDVFVVSDHGFLNTSRTFYPNVLFRQKGWLTAGYPDEAAQVIAVSNGGSGYVYVLEEEPGKREALYQEIKELLLHTEMVGKLFELDDFAELGLPSHGEMEHRRPDFAFEAVTDCFVHFAHEGDQVAEHLTKFKGMHGYLPAHEEMKAVFVASGKSIRAGVVLPEMRIVDVAPTIMRLIGTELAETDGNALDEIWKEDVVVGKVEFVD
jgi:predicted AlkP superfamily pyrophosphatase or phosphodiesterase